MSDETCCGACGFPVHATKEMACDWCRQAADRIEALTAKLAQAEKGLTCIRDGSYGKYASPAAIARATLAEIKGESHE